VFPALLEQIVLAAAANRKGGISGEVDERDEILLHSQISSGQG
jgi:hypothetical protein